MASSTGVNGGAKAGGRRKTAFLSVTDPVGLADGFAVIAGPAVAIGLAIVQAEVVEGGGGILITRVSGWPTVIPGQIQPRHTRQHRRVKGQGPCAAVGVRRRHRLIRRNTRLLGSTTRQRHGQEDDWNQPHAGGGSNPMPGFATPANSPISPSDTLRAPLANRRADRLMSKGNTARCCRPTGLLVAAPRRTFSDRASGRRQRDQISVRSTHFIPLMLLERLMTQDSDQQKWIGTAPQGRHCPVRNRQHPFR